MSVGVPKIFHALRCTQAGRVLMAKLVPVFFAVYYLKAWYARHQQRWLKTLASLPPGGRLLMLAPRAHGKTETILSFITREVAEDRNIRILLVCKTKSAAQKRLRRVKQTLETNQRLLSDYGAFRPSSIPNYLIGVMAEDEGKSPRQINYWTESYIYVERESSRTDPTVEAIGWRGAITGGRFDLIVLDDPIDDLSAASPTERKKAREWLYGTILELLEPTGRAVVIGTRKHNDDLYSTLLRDHTFNLIHDRAVVKWPEHYEGVYETDEYGREVLVDIKVEGMSEVLWPERWPIKALLRKLLAVKTTIGSRVWLRENQNEVGDDSTSEFPTVFFTGGEYKPADDMPSTIVPGCHDLEREWLHIMYPEGREARTSLPDPREWGITPAHLGLNSADLFVIQSWDLSLVVDKDRAERRDTDWTVGITIALDRNNWRRYWCAMWRKRGLHPMTIMSAIQSEFWRWGGHGKVQRVVVESVLFQKVYELMIQEQTDIPIIGHSTGREKADPFKGIPHLSGLAERGKMRFPYKTPADREVTSIITSEFRDWPDGVHDDTLMAGFVAEQKLALYQRKVQGSPGRSKGGRPSPRRPSGRR